MDTGEVPGNRATVTETPRFVIDTVFFRIFILSPPLLSTRPTVRFGSVRLRSSSQHVPDIFFQCLFTSRSLPTLFTLAALAGLKPAPVGRLRETDSHLYYSSTKKCFSVFVAHIPPSPYTLSNPFIHLNFIYDLNVIHC